jgi:hypothetical protein
MDESHVALEDERDSALAEPPVVHTELDSRCYWAVRR